MMILYYFSLFMNKNISHQWMMADIFTNLFDSD